MDAWVSTTEFASLAGLAEHKASAVLASCFAGGVWQNTSLKVLETESSGRGGVGYRVNIDTLPDKLRQDYYLEQAKAEGIDLSHVSGAGMEVAVYRYTLISAALAQPKRSKARRQAILDAVARVFAHPFKNETCTEGKLYDWIRRYEKGGMAALAPKRRNDKGLRRNLICRGWDREAKHNLSDSAIAEVVEAFERYVRSEWRSGIPGWRQVLEYAELRLWELSNAAGWVASKEVCRLNRRVVDRFKDHQLVHLSEADAKLYFDKYLPRIARHRDGIEPMDLVIGDVHPVDIKLQRPDGSEVYARAIAWQDVATNRVWITLIMLRKKEGVRREHIAQSFASMCDVWGLPKQLYLDNGSEYNWAEMLGGFADLVRLSHSMDVRMLDEEDNLKSVVRARPYNAPAKAIEGFFSVLEQAYLCQIPGWVGGDRQRKKTHNVGKEPVAFPGTFAQFHEAFDIAMERYHKRAQATFNDRSPNQVLSDFIDAGWGKVAVQDAALLFAFSIEDSRRPDRGIVAYDSTLYYHDALLPYTGQTLRVRIPKHDPRMIFVFDQGGDLICAATPDGSYSQTDGEGAQEQNRRAGVLHRVIAEKRKHSDRLDLIGEMAHLNLQKPDAPDSPTRSEVTLSDDVRQMLDAAHAAEDAALDAAVDEHDKPTHQPALSQWSRTDESDDYLDAVGFSND